MKNNRYTRLALFLFFVAILFAKAVAFHYFSFHSIVISSLWKNPAYFVLFYARKISFPVLLGSFIFLSRKNWWTIPVLVISDLWCISNLIYNKIFDSFLTIDTIFLAGNLQGGWSSILPYINYQEFVFVGSTIVFVIFLFVFNRISSNLNNRSKIILFTTAFLCSLLLNNLSNIIEKHLYYDDIQKEFDKLKSPSHLRNLIGITFPEIGVVLNAEKCDNENYLWTTQYVSKKSILSYFPAVSFYQLYYFIHSKHKTDDISLSSSDIFEILSCTGLSERDDSVNDILIVPPQLIIILVESFESWVLEKNIEGNVVMPFLDSIVNDCHTVYFHKIKSQTLGGNSGDGQMIINTGLLPISKGVACMDYPGNYFPNFARLYKSSAIINPWRGIWNQEEIAKSYSYKYLEEPEDATIWNDEQVFEHALSVNRTSEQPSVSLIITVSSHVPFEPVEPDELFFSKETPKILSAYLNSLHYTDKQIHKYIEELKQCEQYKDAAIIITGDHTIFKSSMLTDFSDFSNKNNLSIALEQSYCPLIIHSPCTIQKNIKVMDRMYYQMDIFPTIQYLIGDEVNTWRGLGINLMDTCSTENRVISEGKAYELSDKIIRSNFFNKYLNYSAKDTASIHSDDHCSYK